MPCFTLKRERCELQWLCCCPVHVWDMRSGHIPGTQHRAQQCLKQATEPQTTTAKRYTSFWHIPSHSSEADTNSLGHHCRTLACLKGPQLQSSPGVGCCAWCSRRGSPHWGWAAHNYWSFDLMRKIKCGKLSTSHLSKMASKDSTSI